MNRHSTKFSFLYVFGKTTIAHLLEESKSSKKKKLAAKYSKHCANAAAFFEQPSGITHPTCILTKTLCQQVNCPDTMEGGEITAHESKTLDYIGG